MLIFSRLSKIKTTRYPKDVKKEKYKRWKRRKKKFKSLSKPSMVKKVVISHGSVLAISFFFSSNINYVAKVPHTLSLFFVPIFEMRTFLGCFSCIKFFDKLSI